MFFHESPVLLIDTGTFSMLKSVGIIEDISSHRTGIDTVADGVGLAEKIDAIVFPLEFWL